MRVKNSQLDSQKTMLEKEDKELDVVNRQLQGANEIIEKENA